MDIITEQATNERLDALLRRDKTFVELQKRLDYAIQAFDELNLTKVQSRM